MPPKGQLIQVRQAKKDPLQPSKARRHKEMVIDEDPIVVLHREPKKLSKEEAAEWKLPSLVSAWKNQRGYIMPLAQRVATDALQREDAAWSEKHVDNADAIRAAESNVAAEMKQRADLKEAAESAAQREKEDRLRAAAAKLALNLGESSAARMRDANRDRHRDISEKVALGQRPAASTSKFDPRLFTKDKDSGHGPGMYSRPMFKSHAVDKLYSVSDRSWAEGARHEASKAFEGAEGVSGAVKRKGPVAFEKGDKRAPE
ncbi:SKIP/SNW domain [Carpediemonas membranifera]|uniref:SKIP/SNW domain n=1 Tax=Carpediemonas membranifera TaxID=201153 RepID=A0A8J6B9Q2_9EUKA|nr:SKIP/SNW domain [Carpediemonas membranifera]|eukprot:KAG9392877.1 SKIP/SNW domain [Carpediemonas membranifera]